MIEIITIWQAHGDGGEHGNGPVIAYCSTESQAIEAAKGKGYFGSNGHVDSAKGLRADGHVWLLAKEHPIDLDSEQANRDEELREQTLAGLSDEQKRVLGLRFADKH